MFSKTYYPAGSGSGGTGDGGGSGGGITLDELTPMLVDYVTQTQLTPLALKSELAITTALAVDSGMKVADIETTLTTLALKTEVEQAMVDVVFDSYGRFVTQGENTTYPLAPTYLTIQTTLGNKADVSQLPDLTPYALQTQIPDVSGKADRTELQPLALKTEVPDIGPLITGMNAMQGEIDTTNGVVSGHTTTLATKANQSDLNNWTTYIRYRTGIPLGVSLYSFTPIIWLRSQDLTLDNATAVSTWTGPSGVPGLTDGTGSITGAGALPVFYKASGTERNSYVRCIGSANDHGCIAFGNEALPVPFTTGHAMFVVFRSVVNNSFSQGLFVPTFQNTPFWRAGIDVGNTGVRITCIPTADNNYVTTGSAVNAAQPNTWSIVAYNARGSTRQFFMTSCASNVSNTASIAYSTNPSATVVDRTSITFRLLNLTTAVMGTNNLTVSGTYDFAEALYFVGEMPNAEYAAIFNNLRLKYGIAS